MIYYAMVSFDNNLEAAMDIGRLGRKIHGTYGGKNLWQQGQNLF